MKSNYRLIIVAAVFLFLFCSLLYIVIGLFRLGEIGEKINLYEDDTLSVYLSVQGATGYNSLLFYQNDSLFLQKETSFSDPIVKVDYSDSVVVLIIDRETDMKDCLSFPLPNTLIIRE